ncbi:MAG: SDR family oxidoreductase [Chloroflexi bacterium OHK40]
MITRAAFVTGATGQLGSNLIAQLLAEGYQVRALVRSIEKARRYLPGDVQLVPGDMTDVEAFAAQLQGADILFHTAAYFRESFVTGADHTRMTRINVDGTLRLFERALGAGVATIVYASALGVLRRPAGGARFDEQAPANDQSTNAYFQSKIAAERAIAEWLSTPSVRAQRLRLIQILPGGMWGPGDAAPTGFGQVVIDFLKRKLPVVLPGSVPFVDSRDVAAAMLQAARVEHAVGRYIVSQRMVSIAEIMRTLERVSGIPAPRVRVSFPVAFAMAYGAEAAARLTGRPAALTRVAVHALQSDFAASSVRAERELGVRFRPVEETLRDAVAWFRAHGYVPSVAPGHPPTASSSQIR